MRIYPVLYATLLSALCLAAEAPGARDDTTFRVVAQLGQYGPPSAGIFEGEPGLFYLTGQPSSSGVVFSVTARGTQTLLETFPNNNLLQSYLVSAPDGRLYSTIEHLSNPASVASASRLSGGKLEVFPAQNLDPCFTQNLPDGRLLALASWAGPSWYLDSVGLGDDVTTTYQFPPGERPSPSVFYGSDGNYYGVSVQPSGSGYIYRIAPSGTLAKLYTSPASSMGVYPTPIVEAADGYLYSATAQGGTNGTGTLYRVSKEGKYELLYTFPKSQASFVPTSLMEGSDGNIYGTSLGSRSLLFRISRAGQYTIMKAMDLAKDGQCYCQLTQGSDGAIYGVAQSGGRYGGGTVFALDAGLPKPLPQARHLHPSSGAVGTKVLIWGNYLFDASVQFNGVSATDVRTVGPNYVWATVPAGATTGPVTVTTANGTVTTKDSFTVE